LTRKPYVVDAVQAAPRCPPERRLVQPGQLLAWDPSQAHGGSAVADRQWSSRLIVVEVADLVDLACDDETDLLADIAFPDPVVADP